LFIGFFRESNVRAYHQIVFYGNLAGQAQIGIFFQSFGQVGVLNFIAIGHFTGYDFHLAGGAQSAPSAIQYFLDIGVNAEFTRDGRLPEVGSGLYFVEQTVVM
jgi:hypothetical protein